MQKTQDKDIITRPEEVIEAVRHQLGLEANKFHKIMKDLRDKGEQDSENYRDILARARAVNVLSDNVERTLRILECKIPKENT